jgi:maleylpyruvate isomerase
MRPDDVLWACRRSHQAFVAAVAPLSDDDLRAPSLLPGYSRGHVVAHVINKTNAHVWLFGGPPAGEVRRLHPAGYDADGAADDGARRPASELCADLARSFDEIEAAWSALEGEMWHRQGIMTAGPRTMTEVVGHHLRNVEVHHVDLDIGYRPCDWPEAFVGPELSKRLRGLPARADQADLLAWLLGRAAAPELGPW